MFIRFVFDNFSRGHKKLFIVRGGIWANSRSSFRSINLIFSLRRAIILTNVRSGHDGMDGMRTSAKHLGGTTRVCNFAELGQMGTKKLQVNMPKKQPLSLITGLARTCLNQIVDFGDFGCRNDTWQIDVWQNTSHLSHVCLLSLGLKELRQSHLGKVILGADKLHDLLAFTFRSLSEEGFVEFVSGKFCESHWNSQERFCDNWQ